MEMHAVKPVSGPTIGRVRPPGSKSLTNRALVAAALADGASRLVGALESEDTRVMIDSLLRLGIAVNVDPADRTFHIHGCGGRLPNRNVSLSVANSGTTIRFLTALVALGKGTFRLDGSERMRQRPIQDLLDGLAQLGVEGEVRIGRRLPAGRGSCGRIARRPGDGSRRHFEPISQRAAACGAICRGAG